MAPSKPNLRPLKMPKTMAFPSELYYNSPRTAVSDTSNKEEGSRASLSPPSSYTEFLKVLTPVFSPASANGPSFPRYPSSSSSPSFNNGSQPSPISTSSSPATATFPAAWGISTKKDSSTSVQPPSPVSAPLSARTSGSAGHMRPPPPYAAHSPATSSPRSATVVRSPYPSPEWRVRYVESPRSGNVSSTSRSTSRSVSVQHVVTTTVTFKRPPPLGPPPKGKKRRVKQESQ